MNYFEKNIRHISKTQGIPLSKIAEMVGTTRQSLSTILRHNNPNAEFLVKFSEILNISIDDLIKKDLTAI